MSKRSFQIGCPSNDLTSWIKSALILRHSVQLRNAFHQHEIVEMTSIYFVKMIFSAILEKRCLQVPHKLLKTTQKRLENMHKSRFRHHVFVEKYFFCIQLKAARNFLCILFRMKPMFSVPFLSWILQKLGWIYICHEVLVGFSESETLHSRLFLMPDISPDVIILFTF